MPDEHTGGGAPVSRRAFVRNTGLAVAGGLTATAFGSMGRAGAATGAGRRVAVLGGGMAGLAAAHELIERGFRVTVYEPTALGGKARSIPVPGSAAGARRDLPGEHGFRFFPGFYHHVPDTMRRIPFAGNPHGVHDNLVAAQGGKFLRADGRPDAGPFGVGPDPTELLSVDYLRAYLHDYFSGAQVPPKQEAFFLNRLLVFLTSCDERRFGEWEYVSWWDYVRAAQMSKEYQTVLARGLTSDVVAAKANVASTRTIGNMGEAFLMNLMGRGNDGALDRVLNAPTNEAWIDPWVAYLRQRGVVFRVGHSVTGLEMKGGRVGAVRVRDQRGNAYTADEFDWFVAAMPAERACTLWTRPVLDADPSLKNMDELVTDWMVGIQFYLRQPVDIVKGHIDFIDAPWALTALTQAQFWDGRVFSRDYGDGSVVDCLSVDISNWDAPGVRYGKPAKRCTHAQIAGEVWAQIRMHKTAGDQLPDGILHSWFIDPGVRWHPARGRNTNATPLLVNTAGSWVNRPTARTAIPNLFLSGDYVQTNIDLATMEGANESARAAVNALLDASGSNATPATMYKLYQPPEFEALKDVDRIRYAAHQKNLLDTM
jgi:uncharacterized protein with NAD-binding domain and iron-sulfur cluster